MAQLKVEGISKSFDGEPVIRDISIELHKGELVSLLGISGGGKTTLFNALTGSNQYVGNWPGVTVEKKEGTARLGDRELTVVDLPGIYSLSPYSMEEIVARDFIIGEGPDAILNIVDATNLERNLYLTVQLLELERKLFRLKLSLVRHINHTKLWIIL